MNIDDAREAIYARFNTAWAARTPVIFERDAKPKEPLGLSANYVRLTVHAPAGGQETLGTIGHRRYRRRGIIYLQVFTPDGQGMKQGAIFAEAGRAILEGASFGGVDTINGRIRTIASDGKFEQVHLEVDFEYDEIK